MIMSVFNSTAFVITAAVTSTVAALVFILYCFGSTICRNVGRLFKPKPLIKPLPPMPHNPRNHMPNRANLVPYNEDDHGTFDYNGSFLQAEYCHIRDWAVRNNYPGPAIHLTVIGEVDEFQQIIYAFHRIQADPSLIPNASAARRHRSEVATIRRYSSTAAALLQEATRQAWRPVWHRSENISRPQRAQTASIVTGPNPNPTEPIVATFSLPRPALVLPEPETDVPPAYEEIQMIAVPPPVRTRQLTGPRPLPVAHLPRTTPRRESTTPEQISSRRESVRRENLEALDTAVTRRYLATHQPFEAAPEQLGEYRFFATPQHVEDHQHSEEHQQFATPEHFEAPEHFEDHQQVPTPEPVGLHPVSCTHELTLRGPQPQRPARISRFVERFDHETDPVDLARYV